MDCSGTHTERRKTRRQAGTFFQIDRAALEVLRTFKRPATIILFLELASMADAAGNCWPSIKHLADKSRLARSSVKRAIRELEAANLIEVSSGKGCKVTSTYRLLRMGSERNLFNGSSPDPIQSLNGSKAEPRMGPDRSRNGSSPGPLNGARGEPLNENHSFNENQERKPKNEKRAADAAACGFPPSLDVPPFRDAWESWERYRREIRKRLTQSTKDKQLATCATWGPGRAIQAINDSIKNGWTGLFEPTNGAVRSRITAGAVYDPDARSKDANHGVF